MQHPKAVPLRGMIYGMGCDERFGFGMIYQRYMAGHFDKGIG